MRRAPRYPDDPGRGPPPAGLRARHCAGDVADFRCPRSRPRASSIVARCGAPAAPMTCLSVVKACADRSCASRMHGDLLLRAAALGIGDATVMDGAQALDQALLDARELLQGEVAVIELTVHQAGHDDV